MATLKKPGPTIKDRLAALEALHADDLSRTRVLLKGSQRPRWAGILARCRATGRVCVRYLDTGELDLVSPETIEQ